MPRDTEKLINTHKDLRDIGNTVIVVEHDPESIISADWVIDLGPGAGKKGGEVVFQGRVVIEFVKRLPEERNCGCDKILDGAEV